MHPRPRTALPALVTALACLLAGAAPAAAATYPPGFSEVKLVEGLNLPTGAQWGPDGSIYVIEKDGLLKVAEPGSRTARTILDIRSRVNHAADRGLLGLALDRDFATNRRLYLLYTYELNPMIPEGDGPMVSHLERFRLEPGDRVVSEGVILGTDDDAPCPAPRNDVDCLPSDGLSHSIGTVRTAADGTLWVGSGDGADFNIVDPQAFRTYDQRSMAGKIMHVDQNGNGLPGNPLCRDETDQDLVCRKVHSMGFRNPYRFALRPNGDLAVGDVGWGSFEEINLVPAGAGGRNHGWPCREGTIGTPGYAERTECDVPRAYRAPDHAYDRRGSGGAVIGGPEYSGNLYPASYDGSIFFGDYALGFIRRLVPDGTGGYRSQPFASDWAGVSLEQAPNGDLVSIDAGDYGPTSGAVRRIAFGNGPPDAVARATPQYGATLPLRVQFDATATRDPEGDSMTYAWDLDGDGVTDDSTAAKPTFSYPSAGPVRVRLVATDGGGRSDFNEIVVYPGNTPPSLEVGGARIYRGGERFRMNATVGDAEDGAAPAVSWNIKVVHASHIHPFAKQTGTALDVEAITDHDADSYYEISVTATDSEGLAASQVVRVRPETIPLRLDSVPAGAPLSYAGYEVVAPRDLTSAIGFHTTVTAADRFQRAGQTWLFDRWSDGGARIHNISIPGVRTGLTAYYRRAGSAGSAGDAGGGGRGGDPPRPGAKARGPLLRLLSVSARRGRLSGTARDSGGVRSVSVGLRERVRRGKCAWWLPRRKRMSPSPRRCSRPVWIRARLRKVSGGARWGVRLGRRVPKGSYRILVRGVDRGGNASALRPSRATLLRVRR